MTGRKKPAPGLGRLGLCLIAALVTQSAVSQGLTPEELAGKKIYFEGVGAAGTPIQALVGPSGVSVSGETLPCANCHGDDGGGRPEGAVKPANITWPELIKSYGHRHENGREHGPFNDRTFSEALTFGTDPAGNKLDSSMPRFVMANSDIARLAAYLKRMHLDVDAGIAADRLRIGTLLPLKGRMGELGQAMLGILKGQVESLNEQGGVFGRKLELVAAEYPEDTAAAAKALEKLVRQQDVFALVAPFATGIERELSAQAESARIPMVAPFTLYPERSEAVNRYAFHLMAGMQEQSRALAQFAIKELRLADPAVAVLAPDDRATSEWAADLDAHIKTNGWGKVQRFSYPPGRMDSVKVVAEMQQRGVQAIFFLGTDAELEALGKQVRDAIWSPYLLAPGARVGRSAVNLPVTFGDRVYLAYPTLPADLTPKAVETLGALQRKHQLSGRHQPAQLVAFSGMLVLEEGLKRAGRDLSRAKLMNALENLFSFETGVMPTISYGPNRRIGALGAHIVGVDLVKHSFKPTGRYIRLD